MRGFLTVRTRFLLALILPILALVGAGVYVYTDNQHTLTTARQTARVVDVAPEINAAIDALTNEAEAGANFLIGTVTEAQFDAAIAATEAATAALSAEFDGLEEGEMPPIIVANSTELLQQNPQDRERMRSYIKARTVTPFMVLTAYSEVTKSLGELPHNLAQDLADRKLADYLDAYTDTLTALNSLRYEVDLGMVSAAMTTDATLAAGTAMTAEDVNNMGAVLALTVAAETLANEDEKTAIESLAHVGNPDFTIPVLAPDLIKVRETIMSGQAASVAPENLAYLFAAGQQQVEDYQVLRGAIRDELSTVANDQISTVETNMTRAIIAFAVFALLSIGVALLAARSVLTPLNRLTKAADELSEKLPEIVSSAAAGNPIEEATPPDVDLKRGDELGSLARALTAMNATAVHVAGEQASLRSSLSRMFVSIARRDSVLVNRQLAYLDEYERSEESPTVLSRLFALDHLATQMRRNNESLLIISGADTGTRFRGAVAMTDVIRSAISEIDQFERIHFSTEVNEFDSPMHGHVARHAIHLFAELLENATRYSPPTSAVQITARADGHIVRVLIRDQGIGMSDEELAEANARVRISDFSEIPDVDHLGLTVVARLRARCHAVVDFTRPAYGEGILVCVSMPISSFIIKDTPQPVIKETPVISAPRTHPSTQEMNLGSMPQRQSTRPSGTVPMTKPATSGTQAVASGPETEGGQAPVEREAVQLFLNDMR